MGNQTDNSTSVLRYAPQSETLAKFHAARNLVDVIIGPLGSGKTVGSAAKLFEAIDTMPPMRDGVRRSRALAMRAQYTELVSTTIPDWLAVVPQNVGRMVYSRPPVHYIKYRRPDGTIVESQVIFFAADQYDDADDKLRGFQLSFAWVNEMKEMKESSVDMLVQRTGRYPRRSEVPHYRRFVIGDTNAPTAESWLGKARVRPPPNWGFYNQPPAVMRVGGTWVVNPKADNLHNLPPDYYSASLHGTSRKKDDWIRANLANEGVVFIPGKAVHPDFSSTMHVAPGPLNVVPGYPVYYGLDFGRTPAMVVCQLVDDIWLVLRELTSTNTSAASFAPICKRFLEREEFRGVTYFEGFCDPAGSGMAQTRDESPHEIMVEAGMPNLMPAPSNDYEDRFAAVDGPLRSLIEGRPRVQIDPSCTVLIEGLAGAYYFGVVKSSVGDITGLTPRKTDQSHVCEALQYVFLGAGESALVVDGADANEGRVGLPGIEDDEEFNGWRARHTGIVG